MGGLPAGALRVGAPHAGAMKPLRAPGSCPCVLVAKGPRVANEETLAAPRAGLGQRAQEGLRGSSGAPNPACRGGS